MRSQWSRSGARRWLHAALLGALLAAEAAPAHVHADDEPGLYNETHVLSTLAALHGEAPPPAPAEALGAPAGAEPASGIPDDARQGSARPAAGSRGPPPA